MAAAAAAAVVLVVVVVLVLALVVAVGVGRLGELGRVVGETRGRLGETGGRLGETGGERRLRHPPSSGCKREVTNLEPSWIISFLSQRRRT